MVDWVRRSERFKDDVLEASSAHPVLVDFTASWCGPCKALKPVLERLAKSWPEGRVVSVDVDEHPRIATRYKVAGMPTLIVFVDGVPVGDPLVGLVAMPKLRKWLDAAIALA